MSSLRTGIVLAAYTSLFFLLHGIRIVDKEVLTDFHTHPLRLLPEHAQALHGSPLGALIARLLDITSFYGIVGMYLLFAVLAVAAWITYARRLVDGSNERQWFLLLILASSPLFLVLTSWIGKTDPLLMLAYLGFAVSASPILITASAVCMLLAHREAAMLMLLFHFALFPQERRRMVWSAPGIAIACLWYLGYAHILGPTTDRAGFISEHLSSLLGTPPLVAVLAFSWFLFFVVHLARTRTSDRWRIVGVAAAIVFISTFLVYDHTRIAVLLSCPLYLFAIRTYAQQALPLSKRILLLWAGVTLIQLEAVTTGILVNTIKAHYEMLYAWFPALF